LTLFESNRKVAASELRREGGKGSKIWDSTWREERARAYGIPADELEEHYRARTTLKVNIVPADIAEAVLSFASPRRAAKRTGNILNVDGGVALVYPR
jgi:NAD(P)-dependent dehydrogenase (short-subunit alcohol dehydrogenase family)